ncbi:DUF2607 family protein [Vibrio rotiferianus]|uniref:DUF2607 family protein n=1 Tax=Vibrio rotiferianus TaxID=190895 RepID=UPI0003AA2724|nr:DUF2607 family protein [Vibrio rotiferianus]ASI97502.1 hypothetical protein BSZ04_21745 [Vibrio rotiferianus]
MSPRWQVTTHHWRRTVVLLSVALLLAWNFATIAHQLDLIPEHHSHHHCQMFAGSHHGLAKAQPELLPPTYQRSTYSDCIETQFHVSDVRYTARAPPIFA